MYAAVYIYMRLAEQIRKYRKNSSLTQEALVELIWSYS